MRARHDEWIKLGVFARLRRIALNAYDRIVGLVLDEIAVDGCITKAPGGGEVAGPSPVDRRKQGMKRSVLVEGYGIPLGRVLAGAQRDDSPLLAPTLDLLADLGPLPDLSCIGLVTTAEVVEQALRVVGNTRRHLDLLAADRDRGGAQRLERLHDLVDRHPC